MPRLSRFSPQPRPFGLLGGTSWNCPAWSIGAELWTDILCAVAIVRTSAPSLVKVVCALALTGWAVALALSLAYPNADATKGLRRCVYGFALGGLLSCSKPGLALRGWRASAAEAAAIVLCAGFVAWAEGPGALSLAPPRFVPAVAIFAEQRDAIGALLASSPTSPFRLPPQ